MNFFSTKIDFASLVALGFFVIYLAAGAYYLI